MRKSLSRTERIRRRRDITKIFASSSVSVQGAKLFYRKNEEDITRILIVPGRRYGNAVERNTIKRIGREIFRTHKHLIRGGFDLGFLFYPGSYTYGDRVNQVLMLLKKTSVMYDRDPMNG